MSNGSKLKAVFVLLILIATHTGSFQPLASSTQVEAQQQSTLMWSRTWGGTEDDYGRDVAIEGEYAYVTGDTCSLGAGGPDAFLAKYDSSGDLIWNTTWGGIEYDISFGVAADEGDVYIAGSTNSFGIVRSDVFLVKYDADGNQVWNTTWGDPEYYFEVCEGLAVDGGEIYIAGDTLFFEPENVDAFLVKYDADGNQVWNTTWGGPEGDLTRGVAADGGEIYITEDTWSLGAGQWDAFLAKYDADGNQVWNTTWGGSNVDWHPGVALNGGDIYMTGGTFSYAVWAEDAFLVKYDADGNQVWNTTWGGMGYDGGMGVGVEGDDVYITGYTSSFGVGEYDVFLIEFDADGIQVWNTTWGGSEEESSSGVAVEDGDVYITGTTLSFGAGLEDAFLLRYTSGLGVFPYPFVDEAGNLQATFIYGQSDEHGPSHGAWTIDVAGGTLIALTLGRESLYDLPDALIDVDATTFDETQVTGITVSGNLITIGGGDVNLASRYYEFLEVDGRYALPVVDIFNEAGWAVGIHSRHSDTTYYKEGSYGQGTPVTDYASVALYIDGDRYVLYVAGITGFTTKAMCRVLADHQSYSLSGAAVIFQFTDNYGDGTFEGINAIESIPSGWAG